MTMKKIGFDSQKYIELQSARIRERIDQFGGKLYLEFGASCLTISTLHACCRALNRTTRLRCFWR